MDLLKNITAAVDYIEAHLDDDIDYAEVAGKTYFSEHHFKRMFSFIAGMTLSDYVRRRRLTRAAFDLKSTDLRVIDIAMKYGYQSPDSFSRAFQSVHGVTPTAAREDNVVLKAYPRINFQIEVRGDTGMDYRLVEKDAFRVIGKKETVKMVTGRDEFNPGMWETLEAVEAEVAPYDNTSFSGVMHVSLTNREGNIDYYIGTASTNEAPDGMEELEIPPVTWAVFEASGKMPESLLTTWENVYTDWFPSSGYELAEAPELVKGDGNNVEIWIPVQKGRQNRDIEEA